MKRPAFQFYTGDWMSNTKLRRCTAAARGTWMDVLCLMHDSEEYGVLRWPLREVAEAAAGAKMPLLRELIDKGVLKGAERGQNFAGLTFIPTHAGKKGEPVILLPVQPGPIWISSRMVEDHYKAHVRAGIARETSPIGHPSGTPNQSPKGGIGKSPNPGNGDVPSSSTSSSTFGNREIDSAGTTPAGLACRAMKEAGCAAVNPSNAELLDLLARGATPQQFGDLTREVYAQHGPKPMAYLLKVMRSRLDQPPPAPRAAISKPEKPHEPRPAVEAA